MTDATQGEGAWAKLRRRKVVQWGIAYAAGAWERFPPAFRSSKGFKRTLERLGVATYWREHGYPPQCRAVGRDDFICD